VVDGGDRLLVFKSDPITFASEEIGWYAVQVNANDIATTGAEPRWMLSTLLLPAGATTTSLVEKINAQLIAACDTLGISLVGGHTEVTHGLDRPILAATLIGEVSREQLVTPRGARPGDRLLLTKGVPVEATALAARELPLRLQGALSPGELEEARGFLYAPGISVVRDARIALASGRVTAMHDPTEGGLAGALWELSEACGSRVWVDPALVPVPALSQKVCTALGIDPLASIASGALLLAASAATAPAICAALSGEGIPCVEIGAIEAGPAGVWQPSPAGPVPLTRPIRDEIARLFEQEQ
jgi:hydrogenase maturation factor